MGGVYAACARDDEYFLGILSIVLARFRSARWSPQ